MQGETNEPIEIGLDISDLLVKIGDRAAAFLQIESKAAPVQSVISLIDYTNDQREYPYHKSQKTFLTV